MNKKYELFDDGIQLEIPEGFTRIADNEIEKYYMSGKPDVLFAQLEDRALISAARSDDELTEENLQTRLQEYVVLYQRSVANFANCFAAERLINSGKKIAMFYFSSTMGNRNMLTYVMLGILNGKELVITANCDLEKGRKYSPKFIETINSLQIFDSAAAAAE